MSAPRIDVKQARHDVKASDALLVCAYDSEDKFSSNQLEDAIALDDLRSRQDDISQDRELIFYCA